ncbi:MAG TPA: hypothetical protein DCY89_01695 [Gammaproteobacteria bacterium]|nr:hypothetical protein [Gammaproteobacteria bacterium]
MLSQLVGLFGLLGYLGATVGLLSAGEPSRRQRWLLLGLAAAGGHLFVLWDALVVPEGIAFGVLHAASALAFSLALLTLAGGFRAPLDNLLIVLLPLAALLLALTAWLPDHLHPIQRFDAGLGVHILGSLLAHSLFTLAAIEAVWLLIAERRLRSRRPGWVLAFLPPLAYMEQLLFRLLAAGFLLLTVSLTAGMLYVEDFYAQHLVHKAVLASAAWVLFGILVIGRVLAGWRGRTAIRLTLSGFVLLALAYFGTRVVLEFILGRV